MVTKVTTQDGHQLKVRLPKALFQRLQQHVISTGRSYTAEIERAVEAHLDNAGPSVSDLEHRVTVLEESVKLLSKMTIHEGLGEGD